VGRESEGREGGKQHRKRRQRTCLHPVMSSSPFLPSFPARSAVCVFALSLLLLCSTAATSTVEGGKSGGRNSGKSSRPPVVGDEKEALNTLHRQLDQDEDGQLEREETERYFLRAREKGFDVNDRVLGEGLHSPHLSLQEFGVDWRNSEVRQWRVQEVGDWIERVLSRDSDEGVAAAVKVALAKAKVVGSDLPSLGVAKGERLQQIGIIDAQLREKIARHIILLMLFGTEYVGEQKSWARSYLLDMGVVMAVAAIVATTVYMKTKAELDSQKSAVKEMEKSLLAEKKEREEERSRLLREKEEMEVERRASIERIKQESETRLQEEISKRTEEQREEHSVSQRRKEKAKEAVASTMAEEAKRLAAEIIDNDKRWEELNGSVTKMSSMPTMKKIFSSHGLKLEKLNDRITELHLLRCKLDTKIEEACGRWKKIEEGLGISCPLQQRILDEVASVSEAAGKRLTRKDSLSSMSLFTTSGSATATATAATTAATTAAASPSSPSSTASPSTRSRTPST